MAHVYKVTAVKDRYIKTARGSVKAEEGFVVHRSFQTADSASEAVEAVKSYHMPAGTKFDSIRAEFVRGA